MFKVILLFLLFLFIIGSFFGFSVSRLLFGAGPKSRNDASTQKRKKQEPKQSNTPPTKKIITREEGEYVDFEEIKE